MSRRRFDLILGLIVVVAAGLRLAALGRDGLWTDEATTVVLASRSLSDMLAALRADVQAPAHYLLVRGVVAVLGDSELAVRLPSAIAGIVSVALCGLLGRERLGPQGGLAAALLLAMSPLHVAFSREARAYALLGLLALLAFWSVDALRRAPSVGRVALAAAGVAMLPLTHGLGGLHAAGLGLGAALPAPSEARNWRRRALPALSLAGVLALALAAPWMLAAAGQGRHARVAYSWAQRAWDGAYPWQVPLSLAALSPGAQPPVRSLWPGPAPLDLAAALLALALAGLAVARRERLPDPTWPARCLGTVIVALVSVFGVSCVVAPLHVVGRVEVPLAPLAALALGAGVATLRPRIAWLPVAVAAALCVPGLRATLLDDARSDERHLAALVSAHADARDAVVALGAFRFAVEHYVPRAHPGILVRGFPAEREQHPSWVDWSRHDEESLRREAVVTADELAVALAQRGGDDVFLVAVPEPGTSALRHALGSRFVHDGTWLTPLPGLEVDRYTLRDASSGP